MALHSDDDPQVGSYGGGHFAAGSPEEAAFRAKVARREAEAAAKKAAFDALPPCPLGRRVYRDLYEGPPITVAQLVARVGGEPKLYDSDGIQGCRVAHDMGVWRFVPGG